MVSCHNVLMWCLVSAILLCWLSSRFLPAPRCLFPPHKQLSMYPAMWWLVWSIKRFTNSMIFCVCVGGGVLCSLNPLTLICKFHFAEFWHNEMSVFAAPTTLHSVAGFLCTLLNQQCPLQKWCDTTAYTATCRACQGANACIPTACFTLEQLCCCCLIIGKVIKDYVLFNGVLRKPVCPWLFMHNCSQDSLVWNCDISVSMSEISLLTGLTDWFRDTVHSDISSNWIFKHSSAFSSVLNDVYLLYINETTLLKIKLQSCWDN